MNKLFQAIDKYYKKAMYSYTLLKYAAPPDDRYSKYDDFEDPEADIGLPEELINVAHSVNNSDLSESLLLIATLYKKSLELNNGFFTVVKGIYNFKNRNSSELDDEDNPNIEDTLNKVITDLQNRMSKNYPGDTPQAISELQKTHTQFVSGSVPEEASEEELRKDEERDIEEQKREIEEGGIEHGESVVDMTGGLGGDRDDKSKKPGIHVMTVKESKNWIYHYELELASYREQLQSETDSQVKHRISTLIETITKLIAKYKYLNASLAGDQNETTKADQEKTNKEISNLKKERARNRLAIRNRSLNLDLDVLKKDINKPIQNPHQAYLLKQKMDYLNRQLSLDLGKRKESKLRKNFIKLLEKGYKGSLNPATGKIDFSKEESAISEAQSKVQPREEYVANQYQKLKALMSSGTFQGMLTVLLKKIVNYKASVKKDLLNIIYQNEVRVRYTELKPFIDKCNATEANKKNDRAAYLKAIEELNVAMNKNKHNSLAEMHPIIEDAAQRCDKFREITYSFIKIHDVLSKDISSEMKQIITVAIDDFKKLISEANRHRYTNALVDESMKVINYLEGKTNEQTSQEESVGEDS